jgi:hypothetical protein
MTETSVDLIDAVKRACLVAADKAMRAGGFVPEPQLHMLLDRWEQPYLGYLFTRPYRDGADAVRAITRLGDAAAAARATRVVVAWEHADLHTSVHGGGDYPNAMAVVVASLADEHMLHWHPVVLDVGSDEHGLPSIVPRWGVPVTIERATLPPAIAALLTTWRAQTGSARVVFAEMLAEGYTIQAVPRR